MKFLGASIGLIVLIYLLSFAQYNWEQKNKLAAIGSAVLGFVACGLWYFILFFGNYEL